MILLSVPIQKVHQFPELDDPLQSPHSHLPKSPFLLPFSPEGGFELMEEGKQSNIYHDCRDFPKATFHFRNPTCGYVMRPRCWQSLSRIGNAPTTSSMLTPLDIMDLSN